MNHNHNEHKGHDKSSEHHDHEHKHNDERNKHKHHDHEHHNHGSHEHHDHGNHHAMMIEDFKRRFFVSLVVTIPILLLSPMIQSIFSFNISFTGSNYVLFVLSAFIYLYGGWPFLKGLIEELGKKTPGMMTLIAVATTVAFGYSSATSFGLEGKKFFWELATLIDIMLLGHWIEMKSVMGASKSLQKLVELMPSTAHLIKGEKTQDVKVDELQVDDIVLVNPGEKIPVDGEIVEGNSSVNESMITGESKPVSKSLGSKLIAGTINGNSSIKVKVNQIGENAYLNKVIKMVKDAQKVKSKTQHLANKIALWLTIIALTVGFGTLFTWLLIGKPFVFSLERMASVMVITCPHALGLAVPLVVAISTSGAAQRGLLIRNRTAFENARKISLIAFDKTGTLTKGNFAVTSYGALNDNYSDDDILALAGALESKSEHPLAVGILNKLEEKGLTYSNATDVKAIPGKGIEGIINNKTTRIVSPGYLEEHDLDIPQKIDSKDQDTIVFLIVDNKLIGFISMADEIREDSFDAIKVLKKSGYKLFMMTGDNESVAESVSNELGLDGYYAEVLPENKLELIKEFQDKGEFVAMTGDGINDTPALATADIGIAVGSGTDVAAETADIILVNSNPKDIAALVHLGKETYKKMLQNFVWATAYNVVAMPLAAGVLFKWGVVISPAVGAVLMSLSTIVVAFNAQLLKRKFNTIQW